MKTLKTNCLTQAGCAMPDFLRLILICSITVMGLQQTLGQQRTPIPERNIQLPKFYGLYAIHQGKTIPLQGATEPLNFGPYVEFLLFSKNVAFLERWKLYQLPTRQQQQRLQQTAPKKRGGLTDFLNQSEDFSRENEAQLSGIPVGSIELTLLTMPVANQPEMVRIMTTGFLLSGPYQIGDQENWYRFSISGKPNETTSQSPNDPKVDSYITSGIAKAQKRDLDGAIADFSKAIELKPDFAGAYFNRGVAKRDKGDLDGVIVDSTKAIELKPDYLSAYQNRGYAKSGKRDWDGAIADFSKAIELKPDNAADYYYRGSAKSGKRDWDGAIADFSKTIELKPDFVAAYSNRGNAKSKKRDFDGAIADFSKAIELKPDFGFAYNNRGFAKQAKGELDRAIADFSKAIELNPKDVWAYYSRASLRYDLHAFTDAVVDYRKAIELGSSVDGSPTAYASFGIWLIRARQGEAEAATKELRAYLAGRTSDKRDDWADKVGRFLSSQMAEPEFLVAAKDTDSETQASQLCMAYFYAGSKHLFAGDNKTAADYLQKSVAAYASSRGVLFQYDSALAELKYLKEQKVDSQPKLDLTIVCPRGKLGDFKHGTKCTGFYTATAPGGSLKLVDIQLPEKDSAKPYTKSKSLVHAGIDIVAIEGSQIYSVADGTVDDIVQSPSDENFATLGYAVVVEHERKVDGKPTYSLYLHMREKAKVQLGQSVKAGQTVLGLVGSTGAAFGPHVHFEIRHFPGRFNPKWKNIYGIERPKDEATFVESAFLSDWVNMEELLNQK